LVVVRTGLFSDALESSHIKFVVKWNDDSPFLAFGMDVPEFHVAACLVDSGEPPLLEGFDDVFSGVRPARHR